MTYDQRERLYDLTKQRSREKQKMSDFRPRNKPAKPKRWSHQDDLEGLRGQRIEINLNDGTSYNGTLLEADQFTLKIQADNVLSAVTVFKSVMTDYRKA